MKWCGVRGTNYAADKRRRAFKRVRHGLAVLFVILAFAPVIAFALISIAVIRFISRLGKGHDI